MKKLTVFTTIIGRTTILNISQGTLIEKMYLNWLENAINSALHLTFEQNNNLIFNKTELFHIMYCLWGQF